MERSSKEHLLFDILIKNINEQIIADNLPQTDTKQYLHFKISHHTKYIKKPIPYTPARRIFTIITDKNLKKLAWKNYTQP